MPARAHAVSSDASATSRLGSSSAMAAMGTTKRASTVRATQKADSSAPSHHSPASKARGIEVKAGHSSHSRATMDEPGKQLPTGSTRGPDVSTASRLHGSVHVPPARHIAAVYSGASSSLMVGEDFLVDQEEYENDSEAKSTLSHRRPASAPASRGARTPVSASNKIGPSALYSSIHPGSRGAVAPATGIPTTRSAGFDNPCNTSSSSAIIRRVDATPRRAKQDPVSNYHRWIPPT